MEHLLIGLDMPPEAGALLAAGLGICVAIYYIAKLILPKRVFDFLASAVKAWLESRKK